MLEPYVGYVLGGNENEVAGTSQHDVDYSSPMLGARLGYRALGLMAGFEYNMLSTSWEDQVAPIAADVDYKHSNMGIYVGYNFPIMLRVWGTYYFSSKAEVDSGSSAGDEYTGNGKVIGVGFTGLPFLSINLEYRTFTYDEYEDISAGTTSSLSGVSEVSGKEIAIGISIPFELPL
jgi:hypothetical protein